MVFSCSASSCTLNQQARITYSQEKGSIYGTADGQAACHTQCSMPLPAVFSPLIGPRGSPGKEGFKKASRRFQEGSNKVRGTFCPHLGLTGVHGLALLRRRLPILGCSRTLRLCLSHLHCLVLPALCSPLQSSEGAQKAWSGHLAAQGRKQYRPCGHCSGQQQQQPLWGPFTCHFLDMPAQGRRGVWGLISAWTDERRAEVSSCKAERCSRKSLPLA